MAEGLEGGHWGTGARWPLCRPTPGRISRCSRRRPQAPDMMPGRQARRLGPSGAAVSLGQATWMCSTGRRGDREAWARNKQHHGPSPAAATRRRPQRTHKGPDHRPASLKYALRAAAWAALPCSQCSVLGAHRSLLAQAAAQYRAALLRRRSLFYLRCCLPLVCLAYPRVLSGASRCSVLRPCMYAHCRSEVTCAAPRNSSPIQAQMPTLQPHLFNF